VIVSMDPGIRACGVAVFTDDAQLFCADYVKSPITDGKDAIACVSMARVVVKWVKGLVPWNKKHTLVVEWPRILSASRQKAEKRNVDPNDLLALVGVDAAVAMACVETMDLVTFYPDEWKSQVPKKVMNERVWGRLSSEEQKNVTKKDHNVLDAVGLGLHHLGRLTRRRVFG
jgi:hypothetical protein